MSVIGGMLLNFIDIFKSRKKTLRKIGKITEVSESKGKPGLSEIQVDVVNGEHANELLSVMVSIRSNHGTNPVHAGIALTEEQATMLANLLQEATLVTADD